MLLKNLVYSVNTEDVLLVVNGRTSHLGQVLTDGDEIHLIPAISGG